MLNQCHEGNATNIFFKGNKIQCGKSSVNLPHYTKIVKIIDDLKHRRQKLAREYFDMLNNIMLGKNVNSVAFDKIVSHISEIDIKLDEMYEKQLSPFVKQRDILHEKYDQLEDKQNEIVKSESALNPHVAKTIVEIMKKKQNIMKQLSQVSEKELEEYTAETYDEHVEKLKQSPVVAKKQRVVKKSNTNFSNDEKTQIKTNIKNVLKNVFRFKDKEECQSKARSKEYFMTKDEVIKVIDENPDLKKLMPSNFKSLTKEKLCTFIFDAKE
jgi:hypothetical protein